MKSLLIKKSLKSKESIKSKISKLEYAPSITLDLWTDEAMLNSYLGVTIHYVKDKKLYSSLLGNNL